MNVTNIGKSITTLLPFYLMSVQAYAKDESGARAVASMFADDSSPIACSTFHEFDAYQNVYGLLINGDRQEARHLGNVTQAKSTLERLGVSPENIAVVNQSRIKFKDQQEGAYEAQFAENQIYPSNGEGVREAAAYLRERVQKDDLVVVYTTGHGLNGCLVLNNNCYSVDDLLVELSFMKEREAEGIFISDQCYSGSIPQKAVDAGFKVKHAFAPDVTVRETACQLFTPYIWQAIEHCIDVNNDGKTTFADSALFASVHYKREDEYEGLSYQGREKAKLRFEERSMIKTMSQVFLTEADLPASEMYDERFALDDLAYLTNGFVTPEQAALFPKRFRGQDIAALVREDISPDVGQMYALRFTGEDIAALIKAEITSDIAEAYNARFSGEDIAALYKANLEQSKALEYDAKHSGEDIVALVKKGISPEVAREYGARFGGNDIAKLIEARISSETAEAYEKRAMASHIIGFVNAGITPEIVLGYEVRFRYGLTMNSSKREEGKSTRERTEPKPLLVALVEENISPADVHQYSSRFSGEDVYQLFKENISPEDAQKYDARFNAFDIKNLLEGGISAQQAAQYDDFFKGSEIVMLMNEGISADVANTYAPRLDAPDIIKEIKNARAEIHKAERGKECGYTGIALGLIAAVGYGLFRLKKSRT